MSDLTLLHVHGGSIGYGRLGSELAKALRLQGVDVYDDLGDPPFDAVARGLIRLRNDKNFLPQHGRPKDPTNVVCWVSTPNHAEWWYEGQKPCLFTMWEARRLPEPFREILHEFDTIVVPSDQNVELFSQYHDNIRLAYLGVDPDVWHYEPRQPANPYFNFLISGTAARKGADLAVTAFRKLWGQDGSWGSGPVPRLIIKSPQGETECNGVVLFGERIAIVSGTLTAEEEVDLYASAHCYLAPTRGEGFGLQPLQAIAQGLPTILTAAHGQESYAHLGYGISAKPAPAAYFLYGDAGEWWEPSLDELCDNMRWVYESYLHAEQKACFSAREVSEKWTWADTARKFAAAFDDKLDQPWHGTGNYVVPERRYYHCITLRNFDCDISGFHYHFEGGKDYQVPADIKRILFEGGLLHPDCCDEADSGLAPQQVDVLGKYRAEHEHCPSCGQKLNGSLTYADKLYAEMVGMTR